MEDTVTAAEAREGRAVAEDAVFDQAAEAAPQKKQKKPINQAKLQDNLWGWIFCIPLIVGTVWFVYICLVLAFMLSFTDYSAFSTMADGTQASIFKYVGEWAKHIMVNPSTGKTAPFYWYTWAFNNTIMSKTMTGTRLKEIWLYLFNTVFYMIGIPIGMILSMFFAVCMSRDIKGGNVFRVLYYIPCVASSVSIVFTFKTMFSQTGVMNSLLGLRGYGNGGGFQWVNLSGATDLTWNKIISDTGGKVTSRAAFMNESFWCQGILTKTVIIVMSVWKGLGGTIILYIAGLSGVNAATKEAAQIDGANGWTIFWKVTMPDLYPVIFYNIVTSVIGGMQIYAEPTLFIGESYITSGYVSLIYNYGIGSGVNSKPSQGAAYGMILAVIIFVLTMFQFWLDSRNKD